VCKCDVVGMHVCARTLSSHAHLASHAHAVLARPLPMLQLLDFSRSVYEDLSNFDPNGAWACCLDEFVDHLRSTRSCLWDQVRVGRIVDRNYWLLRSKLGTLVKVAVL